MSNISQQKRAEMLAYLSELKKIHSDDESIRALNAIENALTEKKYGLVWEEHSEKVDEMLVDNIPVFTEVEDRKITANEEEPFNFLLEGDNLHSLKLLEKTHKGKIDVIYIDPPYNTGSTDENFMYDDKRVSDSDEYRHSKWLSFMSERLTCAKKVLSSNGVIFISIDNNEFAQLKLLCDGILGENAFVTCLHVELSATQGMKVKAAQNGNLVKNGEFILVYSKGFNKTIGKNILYDLRPEYDGHYSKVLNDDFSISNLIDLYINAFPEEEKKSIVRLYSESEKFRDFVKNNKDKIFRFDKTTGFSTDDFEFNKVYKVDKNNRTYHVVNKGNAIEQLMFLSDSFGITNGFKEVEGLRKIRGDWWKEFYLDMGNVSKEGNMVFKNGKKPVRLIKQLIYLTTNSNEIILDFFAGSGTTGHAVAQLNKEDGGNRKYILCTNNENNICEEVTYQRLKNIQSDLPHNLKYFKTDFIEKFSEEESIISDRLLGHIKEMVELENMCQMDGEKHILVLTDEELEELEKMDLERKAKVYLPSYLLLSRELENRFAKQEIKVIAVPDYYFLEELREVGEL